MKKEGGKKKKVIIVIIIVVILIILAIAGYFILNKTTGFSFGGVGLDFSKGANALRGIGKATNANSFDNMRLNPFKNGTG